MGKGFNNYMCKKFFHPASRDNLKRVWMAQQKDDAYKKKQEELRVQYEKEQDLYNNKAMLSKESKDKLSVNFMYEPPPGAKKEREKEENEPEYKFEWQRKYNAPREDYCKGNSEIQDQPFGILVRNVRCIKCRKWGHINTDKECPLYNQSVTSEIANEAADALSLLRGMREDGLRMRKTALDAQQHVEVPRFKGMVKEGQDESQEIDSSQLQFLKGLSTKAKLKLLKKLEKLESNGGNKEGSDEESEEERDKIKKKKSKRRKTKEKSKKENKKKKSKKYDSSSEESDDSEEEDEEERKHQSKKNKDRACEKGKELKKLAHKKSKDFELSDQEERDRKKRNRKQKRRDSSSEESERDRSRERHSKRRGLSDEDVMKESQRGRRRERRRSEDREKVRK